MTGVDISGKLSLLEEAADSLIVAFPDSFQNRFKVFSGGFYLPTTAFDGYGHPEAFEDMIAVAESQSDYYLLFGRQSDETGIFTKYWVELKLPETGDFVCIDLISPSRREAIKNKFEF